MTGTFHTDGKCWFAARTIGCDTIINRRIELDGIRCYRTRYSKGIVFLFCNLHYVRELVQEYWGRIYFYLDPEKKGPEPIPQKEMDNFILVTSAPGELISLGKVSGELLKGDRVRVKSGLFQGAEGVVKRIKGDRRLIVSINGVTAVATCYIKPELLEKIEEKF